MPNASQSDKSQLDRLPLPLAQLYRRAHNAKSPRDAHDCALYLWEAALKLMASSAIATATAAGPLPPEIVERLKNLARPSLGHWREFTRLLLPHLANVDAYAAIAAFVDEKRSDLPHCIALDRLLRDALRQSSGLRQTVCISELLDRIVEYRNKGLAHAAPATRTGTTFRPLADALLAAASELFARLDVLAGRQLIAVTELRPIRSTWLIERSELRGVAPWRVASLELPRAEGQGPPIGEGTYLIDPARPDDPAAHIALRPLLDYDSDNETLLFLNRNRGKGGVELLCYTTGRTVTLNFAAHAEPQKEGGSKWDVTEFEDESPPSDSPATKGKSIGDYELVSELGRGAMGVVYRARQTALGREVALKIQPRPGDSKADARFRREIRALARVDHPNLVKVFTSGVEGEQFYYTMELLEGAPLTTVCDALTRADSQTTIDLPEWRHALESACQAVKRREKPIANDSSSREQLRPESIADFSILRAQASPGAAYVRQIVMIIRQVAEAAHALHEAGVLHRDIKPGNVVVSPDGTQAVLLDLGLAQLADDVEGRLTRTTQFVGTRRYASPEQQIDARALDRRADVYSIGATLWELLALRPLFGATDETPLPELIGRVQRDEPERLRSIAPVVGRDLEAVVHKCLEKDPSRRYATAKGLADDLDRVVSGEPVQARKVGSVDRALKWVVRRPLVAGLYASIAALVVLMIAWVIAFQHQQLVQQRERESTERRARATALVDSLETADISSVPLIVQSLGKVREEADPLLRERHSGAAPKSRQRMRYGLALLPTDPGMAEELIEFAGEGTKASEVLVLRESLHDYKDKVVAKWSSENYGSPLLQWAGFVAAFVQDDAHWKPHARAVAEQLIRRDALELSDWAQLFDPIHRPLTPALLDCYNARQNQLRSGELDMPKLVDAASQFDLAAIFLARYAADQPQVLAELLQTCDSRHYERFLSAAKPHRDVVSAILRPVVQSAPSASDGEDRMEAQASRRANAAVTLMHFDEPDHVWAMLRHSPDPTARSFVIHALGPRDASAYNLMVRYGVESDISVRRALLLSLGEYEPASRTSFRQRDVLVKDLLEQYRSHPDAGLHGAIDWLLRQKWGKGAELSTIDAELRGKPTGQNGWFVNNQGQTFTVIRGPVTFTMGSPPDEPNREDGHFEDQYRKTIPRSYAIGAREVSVAEYSRFKKDFNRRKKYAPTDDCAINDTNWYEAAAYCRWLSEQEGVPKEQMVYPAIEEIKVGMTLPADVLTRTGYRLPTEAEWEYACRAGSITARAYGRGTDLLRRYGWYLQNSNNRFWPCGQLKPNDLGLFDVLGNAFEWCENEFVSETDRNAVDVLPAMTLDNNRSGILRGGSHFNYNADLRSAYRRRSRPDVNYSYIGFRLARTMP